MSINKRDMLRVIGLDDKDAVSLRKKELVTVLSLFPQFSRDTPKLEDSRGRGTRHTEVGAMQQFRAYNVLINGAMLKARYE